MKLRPGHIILFFFKVYFLICLRQLWELLPGEKIRIWIRKITSEGPFSYMCLGEKTKAAPTDGLIELFPLSWGSEWKQRTPGPVRTSPPNIYIKKQPPTPPSIPVLFLLYSTCTIVAKQVHGFCLLISLVGHLTRSQSNSPITSIIIKQLHI